jgi:hypothetical protein
MCRTSERTLKSANILNGCILHSTRKPFPSICHCQLRSVLANSKVSDVAHKPYVAILKGVIDLELEGEIVFDAGGCVDDLTQ